MVRERAVFVVFVASIAVASGCTAREGAGETGGAGAGDRGASSGPDEPGVAGEGPLPKAGACGGDDATRWLGFLESGSCASIPGAGGAWVATRLFPDAPPALAAQACAFDWTPDDPSGARRPDEGALASAPLEHLTAYCPSPVSLARVPFSEGTATEIPQDPDPLGAPTGVTGCDVCARLAGRHVFAILPADRLDLKRIVVALDTQAFVSFDVAPVMAGSQAFVVALPSRADGASYVEGRVPFLDVP